MSIAEYIAPAGEDTVDELEQDLGGPLLVAVAAAARPMGRRARRGREGFDRGLAAVGLVIMAPAMLLIALAVRLTSTGPALFRQTRVGLNGRTFTLFKFRTMRE